MKKEYIFGLGIIGALVMSVFLYIKSKKKKELIEATKRQTVAITPPPLDPSTNIVQDQTSNAQIDGSGNVITRL